MSTMSYAIWSSAQIPPAKNAKSVVEVEAGVDCRNEVTLLAAIQQLLSLSPSPEVFYQLTCLSHDMEAAPTNIEAIEQTCR